MNTTSLTQQSHILMKVHLQSMFPQMSLGYVMLTTEKKIRKKGDVLEHNEESEGSGLEAEKR